MPDLIDLLLATDPAGPAGVEGLVAGLLADALASQAKLEPSGSQRGRDAGLFDRATGLSRRIDIEVKRYDRNRSPKTRELLGEIAETWLDRPETELWVLVCTAPLSAALTDKVNRLAFSHGIDILVLDASPGGASTLEILIAGREAVTLHWVRRHQPDKTAQWIAAMAAVRAIPSFEFQDEDVRQLLVSRYAAGAAHETSHAWLKRHVETHRDRTRALNQSLGRLGRAPAVPRPRITTACRAWAESRDGETRILALLGGEGDGKTWAAIDTLLADTDRTVLVATSNLFDDGGAESLIAQALARQCGGDADRWRARLYGKRNAWPADFRITLLVDGLNEAPNRRTDRLLGELLSGPWSGSLDVIVTCRTPFWDARIEPYLRPYADRIETVHVGAFDPETEWPIARGHLGEVGALPEPIIHALHNPRLWSFAFDLKDQIGGMREVTLERLLVEHWRLRIREREELNVDPQAFNHLIARSVEAVMSGGTGRRILQIGELEAMIRTVTGSAPDVSADLADLRDGVFYEGSATGGLNLRKDRVPVALGILLAERLAVAAETAGPHSVHRTAAAFLDDLPAMDAVELVVRTAVFVLLTLPRAVPSAISTALRHWVSLQNFERDFYRSLAIVAAAAPEALIRAIEEEASEDQFVGDAATELSTALQGRRDRPAVHAAMKAAASRWLQSYSREHFPRLADAAGPLTPSPITWIETLDDTAAHFLANLPLQDWAVPLGGWARRRTAVIALYGGSRDYITYMPWLGASSGLTDDAVGELIARAASADSGIARAAEAHALVDLLNGDHLLETAVVQEALTEPWDETVERLERLRTRRKSRAHPSLTLGALYGDGGATDAEHWMNLEMALLSEGGSADGDALLALVKTLFTASQAEARSRPGVAHLTFLRDHALALGEAVVPFVQSLGQASNRRVPMTAMAAAFVQAPREGHRDLLKSTLVQWKHRMVDLTGYAPVADEAAQRALFVAARRGDKAAAFVHLTDRLSDPASGLLKGEGDFLLKVIARGEDDLTTRALLVGVRSGDRAVARTVSDGDATVATAPNRQAAMALSKLIVNGDAAPLYDSLRRRIAAGVFPQAAVADGSDNAIAALRDDLHALLAQTVSEDWAVGGGAPDLPDLATAGNFGQRKVRRAESDHQGLSLSLAEIDGFLDVFAERAPAYLTALMVKADAVSDGALITAEDKTWLVTALAARASVEDAIRWMKIIRQVARLRAEHAGLLVDSALRFAFVDPRPEMEELRDWIAERAWNDGDMADVVCMAELEGQQAWLETWIAREARRPERARRLRALLLRGWRASPDDLLILERMQAANAYETFALRTALLRAERRRAMIGAMVAYETAASDVEAWRAHRAFVQALDRRVHVERRQRGWPDNLPRARAAFSEMAAGDYERLVRRNEGDLGHLFGGAAHPTTMPPWGETKIYMG